MMDLGQIIEFLVIFLGLLSVYLICKYGLLSVKQAIAGVEVEIPYARQFNEWRAKRRDKKQLKKKFKDLKKSSKNKQENIGPWSQNTPELAAALDDKKNSETKEMQEQDSKDRYKPDPKIFRKSQTGSKSALDRLEMLIGLDEVKEKVETLRAKLTVENKRAKKGLKRNVSSNHMVFTGKPGTGKTTVAQVVADIFCELGLLSKGQVITAKREDFVGEYIGHSEPKTKALLDQAVGGVLFIDEAYDLTLDCSSGNDYGHVIIPILLDYMENHRDNMIVIAAGYKDLMERFLNFNPGLRSRFKTVLHFEDYTAKEMTKIFELFCDQAQFVPSEQALQKAYEQFKTLYESRDENFGNGRDVRNAFETWLDNFYKRVAQLDGNTEEELIMIEAEDISEIPVAAPVNDNKPTKPATPTRADKIATKVKESETLEEEMEKKQKALRAL